MSRAPKSKNKRPTLREMTTIESFPGIQKVKQLLFLNGMWNATLTDDSQLYIEVIRGQMVSEENWQTLKKVAANMPESLKDTLDGFYSRNWKEFE